MRKHLFILGLILILVLAGCNNDVVEENMDIEEINREDNLENADTEVNQETEDSEGEEGSADTGSSEEQEEAEELESGVIELSSDDIVFIEDVYKIGVPYITTLEDAESYGYGIVVDGDAMTDMDYDYMTYLANSSYVQAQKDDQYYLINLEGFDLKGPFDEETFTAMVALEVYDSEIIPFKDQTSNLWGYRQGEEILAQASYIDAGYFRDGYAVVYEYNTSVYKVIDNNFNELIVSDLEIKNIGMGILGKVSEEYRYMGWNVPFQLTDVYGNIIFDEMVFEALVLDDQHILVSDHINYSVIDYTGNIIDFGTLSGRPCSYYCEASVVGDKVYIYNNNYGKEYVIQVFDNSGEFLMTNSEMNPSGLIHLKDDYYVEIHNYVAERFTSIILPQMTISGDVSYFDEANEAIRLMFGLDTYEQVSIEEVWGTYDVDFDVKVIGDVANIVTSEYWYGFGAAHGNYNDYSFNVDLETGEVYTLGDLFIDSEAGYDYLTEMVQEKASESPDYYFVIDEIIVDELTRFNVTDRGIELYYNPYEIGPYAAGILRFSINIDELNEVLNTDSMLVEKLQEN